jgi:hypothetical protein
VLPSKIKQHKDNLHTLASPTKVRQDFADQIQKLEKNANQAFNGFIEDFMAIVDGNYAKRKKEKAEQKRREKELAD